MKAAALLVLAIFLGIGLTHAESPYAGKYFLISKQYGPFRNGPKLVSGVNLTVAGDGSLTGRGIALDRKPVAVTVTGNVTAAGEVILSATSNGQTSKFTADFDADGKEFFLAFPDGLVMTGGKIAADFPQAGVYEVTSSLAEKAVFFVYRDHSVYCIMYGALIKDRIIHLSGTAAADAFTGGTTARSFEGDFLLPKISGAFSYEPDGGSGAAFAWTFKGERD